MIQLSWVKLVGALYLLWLPMQHFRGGDHEARRAIKPATSWLGLGAFWTTVIKVELTDIVFAIDSILVAVAMSPKLWVIITGGLLGIVAMRLLIGKLLSVVQRFPALVDGAFVIIAWVGIKLLIEYLHQTRVPALRSPEVVVARPHRRDLRGVLRVCPLPGAGRARRGVRRRGGPPEGAYGMIDILYEHPAWFARLFEALDARDVPYRRVHAASLRFVPDWKHDPAAREAAPDLLINRMSPSADRRGHGHGILPTLQYLESAEAGGVRVINGSRAYGFEISKVRQMALLADLGLPFPKTRVINAASEALAATEGLRWPVVVKPSVGGSGAGVLRFDREQDLRAAVAADQLDFGVDHLALVQEFIPARGGHITRVEVLNHAYLYAIHMPVSGHSFNLCPADACEVPPPGTAASAPGAGASSGATAPSRRRRPAREPRRRIRRGR